MERDQQFSSERAAGCEPQVLSYAGKSARWSSSFVTATLLLAAVFATTFWVVEVATSNVMLFHFQVLGPAGPGTYEEVKMEKRQLYGLATEFFWSLPATVTVFAGLLTIGPRTGPRLSLTSFIAIIVGAIAYSWVRWGLSFIRLELSDGEDFCLAMLLAVSAGAATAFVRRRLPHAAGSV